MIKIKEGRWTSPYFLLTSNKKKRGRGECFIYLATECTKTVQGMVDTVRNGTTIQIRNLV